MHATFQILRLAAVIGLVVGAAALATPPGRLPLALRGLAKVLARGRPGGVGTPETRPVSSWRRLLAFLLVVLAAAVAILI